MDWNLIISIVGLGFSLLAILFSGFTFFETQAKIKIEVLNNNFLTYAPSMWDENEDPYYYGAKRIAMKCRIINKSSVPITLYEVVLNNKFTYNKDTFNSSEILVDYLNKGEETILKRKIEEIDDIKLPIIIHPYSVVEGYIVFDKLDKVPNEFIIYLKTTRKIVKYKEKNLKLIDFTKNHKN